MDLRQLRYLVALAEECHFTRAAERMHIAQPALSQQIRRLEDEVGLPLVDRTTRRVALTEAGTLLVDRARRALREVDAARAELAELAGVRGGHVVIGAMQSLGPFDLSRLLAAFHARYPEVELTVQEELSDALLDMLRTDAVDLAFLSLTGERAHERQGAQTLLIEPLVLIVAPGHPLADRKRVRLAELAGEPFVMFREGAGLRHIIVAAARAEGFEPRVAFETNEIERARALVARGLGVSVVPEHDARRAHDDLAIVELHRPALSRDVTLAWRPERRLAPAAAAFLALARTCDGAGRPSRPDTFQK
jgi:DNA-binding transcriptional LysR family regulator